MAVSFQVRLADRLFDPLHIRCKHERYKGSQNQCRELGQDN